MLTMYVQTRNVAVIPKFNSRAFSLSSSLSVEQFSKAQMVEVRFLWIKWIFTQILCVVNLITKELKHKREY